MKLYHGSNVLIEKISLAKCRPYKDFGKGFYLADNRKDAEHMAVRRVNKLGGEPIISVFDFDDGAAFSEESKLRIKRFYEPNGEWARFVMRNRDYSVRQPAHTYDIVTGPIADDDIALSFRLFTDNWITIEELVERLKYKKLSVQYFFRTAAALNFLSRTEK